eukprot:c17708_g1_i1 orf=240-1934(-)
MAGKGPKHESNDGHHVRENYHPKDSSRRAASPAARPSGSGSVRPLDSDAPLSMVGPPAMILEQKLAAQQAEIQRLLGENQLLAVTYVTLRQEFAAAQQELMRVHQGRPFGDAEKEQRFTVTQVALRQELADAKQEVGRLTEVLSTIQAEKDQHGRVSTERVAQMEAELKSVEALKVDFEKIRYEREELVARVERLTVDVKKLPIKDQEIASLKSEVDELRQRHQQARMDFELQKKINLERLEQTQAMEKNTFSMARELERLRAELLSMERRLHGTYSAPSGPPLHSSAPTAGAYENNYGGQEEATKSGQQSIEPSKTKSFAEAAGVQGSQDRVPMNADPEGGWVQHTASNGKLFYYNTITGATQWNKPSSIVTADPNVSYQRPITQPQAQGALNPTLEPALIPGGQQQPTPVMQQPPALQQSISPKVQQGGQYQAQQANYGVNLLVLGLSEGISDRDLASLFHPYGTVLYAKVTADNKNGPVEYFGIVTMETPQAADAAAAAVNGMFILGRHIKVEVQSKGQWTPQQQGYPQPSMQPAMMQGGVGPVRWQHQAAPPAGAGRWPY